MLKTSTKLLLLFVLSLSFMVIACSSSTSSTDGDIDTSDVDSEAIIDGDIDADTENTIDGDTETTEIADKEDEGISVKADIDDGVFWLENAETEFANQAFKRAFEIDPNNPQARFGVAFTEAMLGYDMLFLAVQAISSQKPPEPAKAFKAFEDGDYEDVTDWFDQTFKDTFELIGGHFNRSIELYTPLKESGGLSMTFTHLPIHTGLKEVSWLSGEIDDADVFIFDSMARMGGAVFELLAAHKLQSDLYTVVGGFSDGTENADIIGIITYLLNYNETFLSFRTDVKTEKIARVRDYLLGALEDFLLAASAAETEIDIDKDQSDEIFSVTKDRDNKLTLVMNIWRKDQETDEAIKYEIDLITPEVVVAVSDFRNHILNGDEPIPFDNSVSLSLSSALILPIGFGLLDFFNFSLDSLIPGGYELLSPNLVSGLLTGLLKLDAVALDFTAYFADPLSLREMFPAWTTDKPEMENTFFMEWECPEELLVDNKPDGFFCAGAEETLVDSAHFEGTEYEVEADTVLYKSPYVAMQNPSLGGLFYVNPKALRLEGYPDEPKFQEADQKSFNAALGKILSGVMSFVGN